MRPNRKLFDLRLSITDLRRYPPLCPLLSSSMSRPKISIIGAGHVGGACAQFAATKELGDVVLLDIPATKDMPKGKALDLLQCGPIEGFDSWVTGTTDYQDISGSDIVVVTAGLPRKPGMSRDDLIQTNAAIVRDVSLQIKKYAPDAIVIIVSNPLDVMVHVAAQATGFPKRRVMGQAGALDSARYKTFIAQELNVSMKDISCLLLGGHGDLMVPLPRLTSVGGVPVTELVAEDRLEEIVERTKKGGGEIVALLEKGSAYQAPASGTIAMVESILKDQKRIIPTAAYCDSEYGVGGAYVGVPAILGAKGVEKIVEVELTEEEKDAFAASCDAVKGLIGFLYKEEVVA